MAIVNTVKVHVAPWNYMKAVAFSSGAVNTTTQTAQESKKNQM